MEKTCTQCGTGFEITNDDLKFYDKISPVFGGKKYDMPPPTHCPDCRQQRQLSFRNERNLYKRACDLCNKTFISAFDTDSHYTVYCNNCWWSDKWDPGNYAQEFDFNRPFFEQIDELFKKVPKAGVLQLNNENCEYNHFLAFSKNTYMSPGCYSVENCIYVRKSQHCRDCINSNSLNKCELVAESTNCDECYSSHHLINCRNCSSSKYLRDCTSLQDCLMCCGLHNKQYCFKNKQHSKDEYEEIVRNYAAKTPVEMLQEFESFSITIPKKAQIQLNCEKSSGDYLYNCKNAIECFDCFDIEDSKYLLECRGVKDSMDLSLHDKDIELCYEITSGGEKNYQTKFCYCTVASPRSSYLYSCFYAKDSFGCDGIHAQSQYYILNKQYTKESYEEIMPKIVEHMIKTGEWGEFFPVPISTFAYNETVAQDHFPLTKEEVLTKGWTWKDTTDEIPKVEKVIPAEKLPRLIKDIPDDIINWAIKCEATGRPFRIIKPELDFYRKMQIPIPHFHPDERQKRRIALGNSRKLWDRKCDKCDKEIQTTYAPERLEKVYCESCYLSAVY